MYIFRRFLSYFDGAVVQMKMDSRTEMHLSCCYSFPRPQRLTCLLYILAQCLSWPDWWALPPPPQRPPPPPPQRPRRCAAPRPTPRRRRRRLKPRAPLSGHFRWRGPVAGRTPRRATPPPPAPPPPKRRALQLDEADGVQCEACGGSLHEVVGEGGEGVGEGEESPQTDSIRLVGRAGCSSAEAFPPLAPSRALFCN